MTIKKTLSKSQCSEHLPVFSLASIMCFRMLGLFLILPVFSVYAAQLAHGNLKLIGVALGIYGLTQALLQMPLGMLSDRFGRKPIITGGLLIFAMGSIVAALSTTITGIIIGRALQGAGAVGSTVLALVSDITSEENRSKAMAILGLAIGVSFSLAMVLGPLLNSWIHLQGIFWVTGGFALIGIMFLHLFVPTPTLLGENCSRSLALSMTLNKKIENKPSHFKNAITHPQLLRLDFGIFVLHALLTSLFMVVPILLTHTMQLTESQQAWLYLGVLIAAFLFMVPLMQQAEKKHQLKSIFLAAIITLLFTQIVLLFYYSSKSCIVLALWMFFSAFTLLEASLPSLVSKIISAHSKGTAMGIYSTSQFFGIFFGGSVSGWILSHYGLEGVFLFSIILSLLWLLCAVSMEAPSYLSTLTFNTQSLISQDLTLLGHNLRQLTGVKEVAIMPDEALLYLKFDHKIIKKDDLRKLLENSKLFGNKFPLL